MGAGYLANPLEFLISTLFGLYILALMLRFLLGWLRADFYNPVSQFLVRITNPPLLPLRRIVPTVGRVDTATLVLMIALQILALLLILALRGGGISIGTLLLWSLVELLRLVFNVFIFSIIIQALLSWVNPGTYNPVAALLVTLTEPMLAPIRRIMPPLGAVDLTPFAAIIGLEVLKRLLLPPLLALL